MTVRELIEELSKETYENEKDYRVTLKDSDGNTYEVTGYNWCDQEIRIHKDES